MKIAIACDHGALEYKNEIKEMLIQDGYEVSDFGCHSGESIDYPDVVIPTVNSVIKEENERAILLCGTGIGVSITANKVDGIRCALVNDCFSAKATRDHNDTNVLALGQRIIGIEVAKEIVKIWLETPFSNDERHQRRIDKVMQVEKIK